jgi:hypothetical protein
MAAVFNLNEPAHVVHWHFFQMSVSNIAVIVAMLVVFALAVLIPFPGAERRQAARTLKGTGEQSPRPPGPGPSGPAPGSRGPGLGVPTPARIENEP